VTGVFITSETLKLKNDAENDAGVGGAASEVLLVSLQSTVSRRWTQLYNLAVFCWISLLLLAFRLFEMRD
jgi:hypothetical protein